MGESRTYYSVKNVNYAVFFQLAFFVMQFFLRRIFVDTLPAEYLGINGTFASIISVLAIAELGVGTAITFSMYKPLAENNKEEIAALMRLYKRAYACIAGAVCLLGIALFPFIPKIVGDLQYVEHVGLIYFLFLAETVSSYFFVYKQSLICADQKQFIQTRYKYGMLLALTVAQGAILIITGNYILFLCLRIAATVLINVLLSLKTDRMYPYIRSRDIKELPKETKAEIKRNIVAMMAHRMGGTVVLGTDNVLIALFVGVVEVGKYSNYYLITNALNVLYNFVFSSLVGSIGNLGATESKEAIWRNFTRIRFVSNWLYGFSTTCLIVLFQPFIRLWVGEDYLFSFSIVAVIVINFYVTGMRNAVLSFREALGLFWYDRYKPVAESIINLGVSIVLAYQLGVVGIFIGTLVSTMTTCFWIEPYVLYGRVLKKPLREYFVNYLCNTVITAVSAAITLGISSLIPGQTICMFILRLIICIIVPNGVYMCVYRKSEEFRYFKELASGMLTGKKSRKTK